MQFFCMSYIRKDQTKRKGDIQMENEIMQDDASVKAKGGIIDFEKLRKKTDNGIVKSIFWFLGRGFDACSKFDAGMKREISSWESGTSIKLEVPGGPSLLLQEDKGYVKMLSPDRIAEPDALIRFKSMASAVDVCMGKIGTYEFYARNCFTLKGDIRLAMSVIRCMDIIENYLFPPAMSRKIMRRRPAKSVTSAEIYVYILWGGRRK